MSIDIAIYFALGAWGFGHKKEVLNFQCLPLNGIKPLQKNKKNKNTGYWAVKS